MLLNRVQFSVWFSRKNRERRVEAEKMAVGGFAVDGPAVGNVNSKVTASVVITCIVAASSGLIFGYDIGISGPFLTINFFCPEH